MNIMQLIDENPISVYIYNTRIIKNVPVYAQFYGAIFFNSDKSFRRTGIGHKYLHILLFHWPPALEILLSRWIWLSTFLLHGCDRFSKRLLR